MKERMSITVEPIVLDIVTYMTKQRWPHDEQGLPLPFSKSSYVESLIIEDFKRWDKQNQAVIK